MKHFCLLLILPLLSLRAADEIVNPLAAPPPPMENTVLTADTLDMRSTDKETIAVCVGNVRLTGTNMRIACDRLEIIASRLGDREATIGEFKGFRYLLATGNVHLVQGDREATCGRAEVLPEKEQVILYDNPVVIDHSSNFTTEGERITFLRGERRLQVLNPKLTAPPVQDLGPGASKALGTPDTPTPDETGPDATSAQPES
jgi:lipopolysaccharide export system protein LptA